MKRKATASVSIQLTKAEALALRRLAFRARRAGGRKLSSAAIVRALIRLMKELDVDVRGVRTVEQLKKKLLAAGLRK